MVQTDQMLCGKCDPKGRDRVNAQTMKKLVIRDQHNMFRCKFIKGVPETDTMSGLRVVIETPERAEYVWEIPIPVLWQKTVLLFQVAVAHYVPDIFKSKRDVLRYLSLNLRGRAFCIAPGACSSH